MVLKKNVFLRHYFKTTIMKRNFFIVAFAVVAAVIGFMSCEKEPHPNSSLTPYDIAENADYRSQWVGRYWPVGGVEQRVWASIDENSDSIMLMRHRKYIYNPQTEEYDIVFTNKDVVVHADGTFEMIGEMEGLFNPSGYFFAQDSMFLHNTYIEDGEVISKDWFCVRMPDYIPEPPEGDYQ